MGDSPTISVVIPTHNRSGSLIRTLDALRSQTCCPQQFEVIVVADGCTDDTVAVLRSYQTPFALQVVEQPGQGAATARNEGAAHASGQLLLFIDDDVEPTPFFLEAHLHAHRNWPDQVVMGPYPPTLQGRVDFIRQELRAWWQGKFHDMSQPGYRYTYRDLLSGNLSMNAALFARMGGFDPAFPGCGGEDYEFGARLVEAGVPFVFTTEALAYHHEHETTSLSRHFQRARQEGYTDVLIGMRHPELRPTLPLAQFRSHQFSRSRLLFVLAFEWPTAGDVLVTCIRPVLDVLHWTRAHARWRREAGIVRRYWYWRGVAQQLATRRRLRSFLQGGPARAEVAGYEIELDLRRGLEEAERRLDDDRPDGARIRYGRVPIGRIPPEPGAEPLRGAHLRRALATDLACPLLRALALEGLIDKAPEVADLPAQVYSHSAETVHGHKGA